MTTYKLTMSYDGASFAGFQRQSDETLVTVQGLLEQTIADLFGAPCTSTAPDAQTLACTRARRWHISALTAAFPRSGCATR